MPKISEKDLFELSEELEDLMWLPNKALANPVASRIRATAESLSLEDESLRDKLFEAISFAEEAAGQARGKDRLIRSFEDAWYVFELKIMEDLACDQARVVKEVEV